jgi:hypothetical protein
MKPVDSKKKKWDSLWISGEYLATRLTESPATVGGTWISCSLGLSPTSTRSLCMRLTAAIRTLTAHG